jgi:hypothetical protein
LRFSEEVAKKASTDPAQTGYRAHTKGFLYFGIAFAVLLTCAPFGFFELIRRH